MRSSITTTTLAVLLAAGLLPSAACLDEGDGQLSERSATDSATSSVPGTKLEFGPAPLSAAAIRSAPAVTPPTLPSPPTTAPAVSTGAWPDWVEAEVGRLQTEAPAWVEHLMTLAPKRTRAGFLRLVGPELEVPHAAPVLLHRYLSAGEDTELRAAVIEALGRTRGAYAGAIVDLLAAEPEALVRVALVGSLARRPGPEPLAALELALSDADPQVREAAAYTIGTLAEGVTLAAPMIAALDDPQAEVQLAAARSLGYLHAGGATEGLSTLLTHSDAALRLASLQAIERIDPSAAKGLAQLDLLLSDTDPKVARAAQAIAQR